MVKNQVIFKNKTTHLQKIQKKESEPLRDPYFPGYKHFKILIKFINFLTSSLYWQVLIAVFFLMLLPSSYYILSLFLFTLYHLSMNFSSSFSYFHNWGIFWLLSSTFSSIGNGIAPYMVAIILSIILQGSIWFYEDKGILWEIEVIFKGIRDEIILNLNSGLCAFLSPWIGCDYTQFFLEIICLCLRWW